MYEFEAIGTHWWLQRLDGGAFDRRLKARLQRYTRQFDKHYSRFREDSLVSALARDGYLPKPPKELVRMLEFAREMWDVSEGAFNMSVAAPLSQLGYGPQQYSGETRSRFEDIVQFSAQEVRVPVGTMLDIGGFGKGWLIDEYARILREQGVKQYIVNGGGDIFCQSETPVEFALQHPLHDDEKIGQTHIMTGALGASSTIKRAWKHQGETYHHIIDPATNLPSRSSVVASFVRADTALIADTMATILILRPELEQSLSAAYKLKTILIREDQLQAA